MAISDPYFSTARCVNRLVEQYNKHHRLLIGFDFDDTIFDCHESGFKFPKMLELLRLCCKMHFTMILITAKEKQADINAALKYCHEMGIRVDYVNESPILKKCKKPFVNVFLDDKAGLQQTYDILMKAIKRIGRKK